MIKAVLNFLKITGVLNKVDGFKTYIFAAIMVLTGLLQILNGDSTGLEIVLEGLAIAGLRDGLKKVIQ